MNKITLVGAGSVVFAKNLICDILQKPGLSESTICLMDIDPERLATIETLARRIVAQLGVKAKIEATLDLRAACTGAKYVITTIQVGGYKPSTVVDFEIPAKYGVQQTIADTLGVGGIFRALRSIPEIAKVARMVQEVGAPDPLLLNYTNPMAMIMWGVDRLTGIDSVGLCHSVQGTSQNLANYCGLDYKDISYRVAGINHMAFFLNFEYKGKDAYPFLFRALEEPVTFARDRVRFEMMRRLGYFVTESSEHQSEYNPYFIHHGKEVIEKFGIPINEYIRRCESQIAQWGRMEKDLLDESKPVEINKSVEYGSTIINSCVTGELSVIYGNVPNTGLITNITQGCAVEVPCLVDRQGIQPTVIGALPPQLAAIVQSNVSAQQLAVEAAVTGQRDYIYQAVMADPHTATVLTLDKIWAMCDELIEAHQKDGFLGEFKPVQRNTGKPLDSVARVFLTLLPEGVPFIGGSKSASFQLVAENATSRAFEGEAEVTASDASVTFPGGNKFKISVAAGETVKLPLTLECQGAFDTDVVLAIESLSPVTLERDFILRKRAQCAIPVTATGDDRFPIEVKWSGNLVAKGGIGLTPTECLFNLWVDDTDVKICKQPIWEGSVVELGLKNPLTPQADIINLAILPDPEHPELLIHYKTPFEGGSVKVQKEASGYSLEVRIDLAKAKLDAKKPFLFEVICHVSALGTAHGRTRAAWQGSSTLESDQTPFAWAIPTAK